MIVAINNNKVPIIPELFLNNFLPNIPSNKKPANGNNGMSAMYMAFGMLLFVVSGRDQKFYGQTETVRPEYHTIGHLKVDCSWILFPVACEALVASITSNTCNACSTLIRGSLPVAMPSIITDAPISQT
jgi:hypothetical protein